jgi:hypothetical protein
MNKFFTTTAIVTLLAAPAFAQEITFGQGGLSYDLIWDDSNDASSVGLNGEVEYSFDQFLFGANVNSQTFDIGSDGSVQNYGAFAAYAGIDNVLVGAGLTGFSIDTPGPNGSENGYEVFGQYTTGQFSFAANYRMPVADEDDLALTSLYGEASVTPDITLGAVIETQIDVDETIYHVSADYAGGPISGRAYYFDVTDVDGAILGLEGAYAINNMFSVSAAIQSADLFGDDFTAYSVGGSYVVSDGFTVDASIGQFSEGSNDIMSFGLAVNYEIGSQQRLDRRLSDAARADIRAGFGLVAPTLDFTIFPGFGI